MAGNGIDEARRALEDGSFGNGLDGIADAEAQAASDAAVADFIAAMGKGGDSPYKANDWKVHVPSGWEPPADGVIVGRIAAESESAYIVESTKWGRVHGDVIGYAGEKPFASLDEDSGWLVFATGKGGSDDDGDDGTRADGAVPWTFTVVRYDGGDLVSTYPARVKVYDATVNLFSRNSGILESDVMLDKTAVLIGCGSVGSLVALELARSGVGNFVLIDSDTLEIHNVCRHQCGFSDLGRYKVHAVRDRIIDVNPSAKVTCLKSPVERISRDELDRFLGRDTVIIGGGDNRASADYGCRLACETDSSFVATCCWTRAFAGEVFYWQSGHGLSCYSCALGGLIDTERPEAHSHYFGEDEEVGTLSFEPGVAADIDFVTTIAVKVALDLLNRDNAAYTPRLLGHLRQYTWICNTNEPAIGGERAAIFSYPLQVTTTLKVNHDGDCPMCGNGGEAQAEG